MKISNQPIYMGQMEYVKTIYKILKYYVIICNISNIAWKLQKWISIMLNHATNPIYKL